MISGLLDQATKLFGHRFLVAAFMPSALFVAGSILVLFGFQSLTDFVAAWLQKDWKDATFSLIGSVLVIFAIAYVLYGMRSFIHALYQGLWPAPLRWLLLILRLKETKVLRRRSRIESARLERLDDLDLRWVADPHAPIFSRRLLVPKVLNWNAKMARRWLARRIRSAKKLEEDALRALAASEEPDAAVLRRLLYEARTLHAKHASLPAEKRAQVGRLVQALKQGFLTADGNADLRPVPHLSLVPVPKLASVLKRLREDAHRDWVDAYDQRYVFFPSDERWLRPMRLGNVAMVQQEYPLHRYGIVMSELWPRLTYVLPDGVREKVDDVQTYLDFTVMVSALAAALALLAFGEPLLLYLDFNALSTPGQSLKFSLAGFGSRSHMLATLAFLVVSYLFYRLAVGAQVVVNRHSRASLTYGGSICWQS
jgi:hypothetical protein